ncbi:cytochrome-c peroxidase [Limimaricola cinnabarinus]|uniref:Cytochrome-c peroxidase n=1 Tax=Limimaricola cinnabarinus TaxID=1125964 RepID=A0A2G1MKU9_9RHOB|nr:cytochrome c peroxidase [Limimaricola cinnabarinus]PHP29378.1 cytochrome-c peroxidase [Limimaricola cinnabarinus]
MRQVTIRIAAWVVLCWPGAALAESLPAPLDDAAWPAVDAAEAALGRLLFYDPILSGNREVACATCHHPAFGTSDGLSLPLGDGGRGLGPARAVDPENPPEQRVPRNSQALWNVGAHEYVSMFHDGRVERDPEAPGGLRTPLDADMVAGFASMLSAQTMFPVLSPDEMAGHYSENEVAQAVRQGRLTGPGGAWELIARRVAALPGYARRFEAVYGLAPDGIGFTDISNAIAAFITFEFRSDTSPFDARLREGTPLPPEAEAGLGLFYGPAGCSDCHSGPFLTDHGFHAMGAPQIGPGKAARFESHARDEGRFRVTGRAEDRHAFRTPSLRNVALTAPYGHAGSHATLRGFVADHLDPVAALARYDRAQAVLPRMEAADWRILDDAEEAGAIGASVTAPPVVLREGEIDALVAFLEALSDPVAAAGRLGVPDAVPSGLTVPNP